MSEPLSAFDLLENDHSGAGLRKLTDALNELKASVRTKLDAGLDADSFAVGQKVLQAVETGEDLVVRLHDKMTR